MKKGRIVLYFGVFIIISISLLFIFNYYDFNDTNNKLIVRIVTKEEKLLNKGYNKEEIKLFKEKLNKNDIKKLIEHDYLSYLNNLINDIDYDSNNLFKYIDYIQKLEIDYNLNDIVYIVNNNITYPYSEKLASLINHKYFIFSRLDRYINYKNDDINTIITNVNSNLDYDFYTNVRDTDITKGNLLIVNKFYKLPIDYYYGELVKMDSKYDNQNGDMLNSIAYEAFKKLVDDSEKLGYHIRNNSAYRSYTMQENLYNSYSRNIADKWCSRAGHSEHQTGLALDVGVEKKYSTGIFENSREFRWMKDNAHLYGFILRYPKGKEYITGYSYEPWHYRYVGVEIATYIYQNDITFEEYYAYFVENN